MTWRWIGSKAGGNLVLRSRVVEGISVRLRSRVVESISVRLRSRVVEGISVRLRSRVVEGISVRSRVVDGKRKEKDKQQTRQKHYG